MRPDGTLALRPATDGPVAEIVRTVLEALLRDGLTGRRATRLKACAAPEWAGLHAPDRPYRSRGATPADGPYGAVTVRSPRRGEANASRSARVRPVSLATSAVSSAPQSMPRSR